jgi:hypothetical protein
MRFALARQKANLRNRISGYLRYPANHRHHGDTIRMRTRTLLISRSIAFLLFTPAVVLCQASKSKEIPLVPNDVHQLFLDDQNERGGGGPVATYGADSSSRDAARRARVKDLLATGKIQTATDFHDAAYIFQHGENASDYLLAHILAVEAIAKGDASSRWLSAATLDRYLQSIGKGQVFGTQYITGSIAPDSQNGILSTSQRSATIKQEPYDRELVPDSVRLSFCVPKIEQQKANLKEFQAGRYPSGILPPGCIR